MEMIDKKIKLIATLGIGIGGFLILPTFSFASSHDMCSTQDPLACQVEQQISDALTQVQQGEQNSNTWSNGDMWYQNTATTDNSNKSISYNSSYQNGIWHTIISGTSSGFLPQEDVNIYLNGQMSTRIKSDAGGWIHYSLDVPNDISMISDIQALGISSRKVETWQMP